MRRQVYLLIGVIGLYLITAFALHLVYGPSYEFPQHENEWRPDGSGGWVAEGQPTSPMPTVPSENVPIILQYLPFFIPGLLLVLFLFTPLSHVLERRPDVDDAETGDEIPPDDSDDTGRS